MGLWQAAYELRKVVTLGSESSQSLTVSILGRTLTFRQWGIEYEPDQLHVSRALGQTYARAVATPGTDDAGGLQTSEIRELRRTPIWREPPEEIRKEIFSLGKN